MRSLLALLAVAACASNPRPRAPTEAAPAPIAALPDIDIRYRVTGEGPALVLIHGNFSSLETWAPVVPALAKHFRVITLDLPGYGETENKLGAYDAGTYAMAVARVMDAAGADHAILVGNSLGGAVAEAFAARFPERTAGLVLESPSISGAEPIPAFQAAAGGVFNAAFALHQAPDDAALHAHLREQVAAAARISFRDTLTDSVVDDLTLAFTGRRFQTVLAVSAAFRSGDLPPAVVAARKAHPFPILVVWGAEDALIPVVAANALHAWYPDARTMILGGVGHVAHFERPAVFAALVTEAFAAGSTFPRDDRFVPDGTAELVIPGAPGTAPWLHRLLRSATRDRLDAAGRFLLANDQLALDDLEAATATVATISDGAPGARGFKAYIEGARAELAGQSSRAAYLTALRELPVAYRGYPLVRLARQPLDGADAREVDTALASATSDAPVNITFARIDRALVQERYADALALLTESSQEPAFALRRAWAYAGAGSPTKALAELAQLDKPITPPPPPSAMPVCRGDLDAFVAVRAGHLPPDRAACTATITAAELGSQSPLPPLATLAPIARGTPPVRWDDKPPTASEPRFVDARAALAPIATTPAGAMALAAIALQLGDLRGARATLDAVPTAAAAQVPELHRMRLAIRAALGDRTAATDARALVRAHPDIAAWHLVEGTTLVAAGRYADAQPALGRALALSPDAITREAAAVAFTGLGDQAAAAAITAQLREAWQWNGTWMRWLPARKR